MRVGMLTVIYFLSLLIYSNFYFILFILDIDTPVVRFGPPKGVKSVADTRQDVADATFASSTDGNIFIHHHILILFIYSTYRCPRCTFWSTERCQVCHRYSPGCCRYHGCLH